MVKRPVGESLSADDVFEQLHGSSDSSVIFTGLIKRADDNKSVMLSADPDGGNWKSVPTSIIRRVQFVGHHESRGETHAVAHVFFKPPTTDEGRGFASVAQLHRTAMAKPSVAAGLGPIASGSFSAAPSPTISCPNGYRPAWDMATQQWFCEKI